MPDIIVKQQPATSLTIQSNSTQLIIRQAAANNITVATTGNSYVLPAATNSTLGGIIVGSNLTIANGVLSATSSGGGVTAFNNRTGNVTLLSGDITNVLGNATYLEVRPYSGQSTANYPNGTQSVSYGRNAQYTGSPLYQSQLGQSNIGINSTIRAYTACTTSANSAERAVGNFDVTFQTFSYDGQLNRTTGFRLTHSQGVPFLTMIGQPQLSTYADVNNIGDFMLTKSQLLLLFYTRQQIDSILLNYQRIN